MDQEVVITPFVHYVTPFGLDPERLSALRRNSPLAIQIHLNLFSAFVGFFVTWVILNQFATLSETECSSPSSLRHISVGWFWLQHQYLNIANATHIKSAVILDVLPWFLPMEMKSPECPVCGTPRHDNVSLFHWNDSVVHRRRSQISRTP